MTEEVDQVQDTPEGNVEQPQVSEIEQRALDMGWKPREEFEGSDDDFIDAKEFVRRKPLFDKIESQSKEVKNLRKAFESLSQHYTKVNEAAYQRAYNELKIARRQARADGDFDREDAIEDEMKRVETQAAQLKQLNKESTQASEPPQLVEWKSKNKWYGSDEDLTAYADSIGTKLNREGMAPDDVLVEVEKRVKANFPHKFKNPRKESAPHVEQSGGRASRAESFEMTDLEKKIMNDITRQINPKTGKPVITKEQYIADLKAVRSSR